jgi:hypothetical protein
MTPVESSDVLVYAPELSALNPAQIEIYLDLAKSFVFETKWGAKYKSGVCLLTAHFLTLQSRGGGASGHITSESVGELSVSYSSLASSSDEDYKTTTYGSMYIALRKTLKITPLVV